MLLWNEPHFYIEIVIPILILEYNNVHFSEVGIYLTMSPESFLKDSGEDWTFKAQQLQIAVGCGDPATQEAEAGRWQL